MNLFWRLAIVFCNPRSRECTHGNTGREVPSYKYNREQFGCKTTFKHQAGTTKCWHPTFVNSSHRCCWKQINILRAMLEWFFSASSSPTMWWWHLTLTSGWLVWKQLMYLIWLISVIGSFAQIHPSHSITHLKTIHPGINKCQNYLRLRSQCWKCWKSLQGSGWASKERYLSKKH